MTFQQRAGALKALGKHLSGRIPQLTELSLRTGATRRDSAIDIDGGIGVLFVYASKGAKELPDQHILRDGDFEPLGKTGTFGVQHVLSPLLGAFVQINAFNFPVWGMLEKFAPAFLAGMPSIVKPASQTAYLTELAVREIVASGLIPDGALQLVCARPDGLLESLTGQDVVSVTGSHATATALRRHPTIAGNAVRFTAEADSLNSSILGEDVAVGSPEFDIFVRGLVTEMTQKAGQKCTAIRRAFVPRALADDVESAVCERLSKITVGDPRDETVRMGPLVGLGQRDDVRAAPHGWRRPAELSSAASNLRLRTCRRRRMSSAEPSNRPVLLRFDDPKEAEPHAIEAFGPVSSLLPYDSLDDALDLVTPRRRQPGGVHRHLRRRRSRMRRWPPPRPGTVDCSCSIPTTRPKAPVTVRRSPRGARRSRPRRRRRGAGRPAQSRSFHAAHGRAGQPGLPRRTRPPVKQIHSTNYYTVRRISVE